MFIWTEKHTGSTAGNGDSRNADVLWKDAFYILCYLFCRFPCRIFFFFREEKVSKLDYDHADDACNSIVVSVHYDIDSTEQIYAMESLWECKNFSDTKLSEEYRC